MNNLQVELGIAERRVIMLDNACAMKPNNIHLTSARQKAKEKVRYFKWLTKPADVEVLDGRPD